MFEINYKIINNPDLDDYYGQQGFFQITCNGYSYGEIYSKYEEYMDLEYLDHWFQRIVKALELLVFHEQVFLTDVESYDTWIRFEKRNTLLYVSIVNAEKPIGTSGVEYTLENVKEGNWWQNQPVKYGQFKEEVIKKSSQYLREVLDYNDLELVFELGKQLEHLETRS